MTHLFVCFHAEDCFHDVRAFVACGPIKSFILKNRYCTKMLDYFELLKDIFVGFNQQLNGSLNEFQFEDTLGSLKKGFAFFCIKVQE